MRSFLSAPIFLFLAVFSFASAQSGTPCNEFGSGSAPPQGYGASWNVLSTQRELLVSSVCRPDGADLTVGSGASNQMVYKFRYTFNTTQQKWLPVELNGTFAEGSTEWLAGRGTYTVGGAPVPFFWVGYVCQWTGTVWKCGCRDAACATPMWQLQSVVPPGNTTTGGTTGSTSGGTTGGGSNTCTSRGYTRIWAATPGDSDIGKDILQYLKDDGFAPVRSSRIDNLSVVRAPTGEIALKAHIPKGGHYGVGFRSDVQNTKESMCLRYRAYLPVGSRVDDGAGKGGGKLPGLWGGDPNGDYEGCGTAIDVGNKGFSARMGFHRDKATALYLYYANKSGSCGATTYSSFRIPLGQWFTVEEEVVMNTVGQSNGVARHWANGAHETVDTGIIWRNNTAIKPRGMYFDIYFGGTWVSPITQDWYFKDFEVYVK